MKMVCSQNCNMLLEILPLTQECIDCLVSQVNFHSFIFDTFYRPNPTLQTKESKTL